MTDCKSVATKDKLLDLIDGGEVIGMTILIYQKGGEGPEGIVCRTFADDGMKGVPNVPDKMRKLADKWEIENDRLQIQNRRQSVRHGTQGDGEQCRARK